MTSNKPPHFVSLGMFIIDEFAYLDKQGKPTREPPPSQIGGGGTYATVGARIWLPTSEVGMIVDRGSDWPSEIQTQLESYGDIWHFRDRTDRGTTRALNSYRGDHRAFDYLTPRIRITPRDLEGTNLAKSRTLHFICSPSRASEIMSEVHEVKDWQPTTIFEPIPDRCVPEELPALIQILPSISILSPNAEEALSLLSIPLPETKSNIEQAGARFLDLGVGPGGNGSVIIRSGALGAYVTTREKGGRWIDAFWLEKDAAERIVDVTGAGNSFLGGLAAGLYLANHDVYEATFYAAVSASFTIEQGGLPRISELSPSVSDAANSRWNKDSPLRRLTELQQRHANRW